MTRMMFAGRRYRSVFPTSASARSRSKSFSSAEDKFMNSMNLALDLLPIIELLLLAKSIGSVAGLGLGASATEGVSSDKEDVDEEAELSLSSMIHSRGALRGWFSCDLHFRSFSNF